MNCDCDTLSLVGCVCAEKLHLNSIGALRRALSLFRIHWRCDDKDKRKLNNLSRKEIQKGNLLRKAAAHTEFSVRPAEKRPANNRIVKSQVRPEEIKRSLEFLISVSVASKAKMLLGPIYLWNLFTALFARATSSTSILRWQCNDFRWPPLLRVLAKTHSVWDFCFAYIALSYQTCLCMRRLMKVCVRGRNTGHAYVISCASVAYYRHFAIIIIMIQLGQSTSRHPIRTNDGRKRKLDGTKKNEYKW